MCFFAKIVLELAIGSSFIWFLSSFGTPHHHCFFFLINPYSLALQVTAGSSCLFPALVPESAISPRALDLLFLLFQNGLSTFFVKFKIGKISKIY